MENIKNHIPTFGDIYYKSSNQLTYIYISDGWYGGGQEPESKDFVNLTAFSDAHGGLHAVDRRVRKSNFAKLYTFTGVNVGPELINVTEALDALKHRYSSNLGDALWVKDDE